MVKFLVTQNIPPEVLPHGTSFKEVANLQRRERSIYWRRITVKGGDMVWMQTELLPSDVQGRAYYLSKGFRLTPPEGVESPVLEQQKLIDQKDDIINTLLKEVAELKQLQKVKKRGKRKVKMEVKT